MVFQTWNHREKKKKKESNSIVSLYDPNEDFNASPKSLSLPHKTLDLTLSKKNPTLPNP